MFCSTIKWLKPNNMSFISVSSQLNVRPVLIWKFVVTSKKSKQNGDHHLMKVLLCKILLKKSGSNIDALSKLYYIWKVFLFYIVGPPDFAVPLFLRSKQGNDLS